MEITWREVLRERTSTMSIQLHPTEKIGVLHIPNGIKSEGDARAIKAALEDLPGVHAVELARDGANIRFDPDLVSEQQFYTAVKIAGFHASDLGQVRTA
jgi:copper chaperone CopZ